MEVKKCVKPSFCVIGKEGSTDDGSGFVQRLWEDANSHFNEVEMLAKRDSDGRFVGFWGAMSDLSRRLNPWENNFSKGLYLAGVEVNQDAQAPANWTKWTIPAYEYIYVKAEDDKTFTNVLKYMEDNNYKLVGAVHDFISPSENGQRYMFFPIRKVNDGE